MKRSVIEALMEAMSARELWGVYARRPEGPGLGEPGEYLVAFVVNEAQANALIRSERKNKHWIQEKRLLAWKRGESVIVKSESPVRA